MIAACPRCEARYRVDEAKLSAEGARVRCARCSAIFRVHAPATPVVARPAAQAAAVPSAPAAAKTTASTPVGQPVKRPAERPRPAKETAVEYQRDRLVLVADPQEDSGKSTASALTEWGLQVILVHDGVEAMLGVQRALPRVVILDAALPKMFGFQVCEVIKRNEMLSGTKVILVGAIHNRDRYRRPPGDLYGADVYVEQPDLPDGLREVMVQFGLPIDRGSESPVERTARPDSIRNEPISSAPSVAPEVVSPAPIPAAADAPADGELAVEREKAERLARIVVSDIVLYQGEKFEEAIRAGNLLQALDTQIEEGRNFFRQRISEEIRNERDHLIDELMRVARERGMK